MRIRHIEIFHAIMQAGSLSKAAASLCISQPAASKMLAQAERAAGMPLFRRTGGALQATPEAELLFVETKKLHSSLDGVRRLARNLASHSAGHLRIACVPSLGLSIVPQVVTNLLKACPDVSLNLQTHNSDAMSALLLARDLDIGFAFNPPPRPGIEAIELARARVVYLGSPADSAMAGGAIDAPVALATLDPRRWIGLGTSDPLGDMISQALRELGCEDRMPVIEVHTYYLARALVACGAGFTVVDEFTADAQASGLLVRPVAPALSIGVFALYAASSIGIPARQMLIDLLRQRLQSSATPAV